MDSKTPVTLLQELLLKRGCTPDYVLVHNGVGTHNPLFVYEVSGLGKTAVGRGKSKREAKHAAAQELLYSLNLSDKEEGELLEEVIQSPYADVLKDNAVGALQDFCCMHKIGGPTYEQTRDEGLPHAKLFGMKCRVSNLITIAESRTKKQAKQNASLMMLQKLKECLNDDSLGDFKCEVYFNEKETLDQSTEKKVTAALDQEGRLTQPVPLGTPLDLYDQLLKDDIYPRSEVLERLKTADQQYFNSIEDPLAEFAELAQQMELNWEPLKINTRPGFGELMSIQMKGLNEATFFGRGNEDDTALQEAALSALKWFSVMAL